MGGDKFHSCTNAVHLAMHLVNAVVSLLSTDGGDAIWLLRSLMVS